MEDIYLHTSIHYRYRIWHYSGTLLQEVLLESGHELWESAWQPAKKGEYPEKPIKYSAIQAPESVPQPEGLYVVLVQMFITHDESI